MNFNIPRPKQPPNNHTATPNAIAIRTAMQIVFYTFTPKPYTEVGAQIPLYSH